jgi:hypothetical protein
MRKNFITDRYHMKQLKGIFTPVISPISGKKQLELLAVVSASDLTYGIGLEYKTIFLPRFVVMEENPLWDISHHGQIIEPKYAGDDYKIALSVSDFTGFPIWMADKENGYTEMSNPNPRPRVNSQPVPLQANLAWSLATTILLALWVIGIGVFCDIFGK